MFKLKYLLLATTILIGLFILFSNKGSITGYSTLNLNQGTDPNAACSDCNVILILIDTLRADHVGAYGYDRDITPNIDKLAEEGILFKNMLAQSSYTRPGTSAILTGMFPKNSQALEDKKFPSENILISEILKKKGYSTSAFITNVNVGPGSGFDQGYDTYYFFSDYPEEKGYAPADQVNEKVIPFIKNFPQKNKNFLYIHYMDPHDPYLPQEKHYSQQNSVFLNKEKQNSILEHSFSFPTGADAITIYRFFFDQVEMNRYYVPFMVDQYDDEIIFVDKMIGDVIQTLKEEKIYDNSIIIVVSDHGEEFMEHLQWRHGSTLFNEQLQVPLIMKVPGMKSEVVNKIVNQIDLVPTLSSLLGIKLSQPVDGRDIFSKWERTYSFAELQESLFTLASVQTLKDKLIVGQGQFNNMIVPECREEYTWFVSDVKVALQVDDPLLKLMSFRDETEVLISAGEDFSEKVTLSPQPLTILLEPGFEEADIVSLTPCQNISTIALNNNNNCLSFGVLKSFSPKGYSPYYRYFNLIEDEYEQENIFFDVQNKNRIKELDDVLLLHIEDVKKEAFDELEEIDFTDQQLEQLKALGYI